MCKLKGLERWEKLESRDLLHVRCSRTTDLRDAGVMWPRLDLCDDQIYYCLIFWLPNGLRPSETSRLIIPI